jgi:hypothetical protein
MFLEQTKQLLCSQNSLRFSKRYPTKLQWQMLRKLQVNSIELEVFVERWQVSHKELAQICFCSVDTVDRWFIKTDRRREPSPHHKFFLGLANKLWTDLLNREER